MFRIGGDGTGGVVEVVVRVLGDGGLTGGDGGGVDVVVEMVWWCCLCWWVEHQGMGTQRRQPSAS